MATNEGQDRSKILTINELLQETSKNKCELKSVNISDPTLPIFIFDVNGIEMKYGLSDVMLLAMLKYVASLVFKSDALKDNRQSLSA